MLIPFRRNLKGLADGELMGRVAGGDERAFEELHRRYARRLQGFFYRMLAGDGTLAADFTQDTFLRLWTARGTFRRGTDFAPWLFTMAYNLCRNEYRHRDAQEAYAWEAQAGEETAEDNSALRIDAAAFDRALAATLAGLPREPRTLFALRFEEELTVPQVAAVLGIPEGTVKSRLHHLQQHLKRKLRAYENL